MEGTQVAETEAAAVAAPVAEALPVKDEEKKEEPATPAGEEDKKEDKPAESTETPAASTEATPAPTETPAEPAPSEVAPSPTEPAAGEPAPAPAAEATPAESEKPAEPVKVAETEAAPAPAEPAVESAPEPEPAAPAPAEEVIPTPVAAEIITAVVEEKLEEVPPPLPASPPPTEAPPPTPVAPTPAAPPVDVSILVQLGNEAEAQENDVAGGGGESMAELPPGDVEPVLDVDLDDKKIETTLVNGVSEETQKIISEVTEKVSVATILSGDSDDHLVSESTEVVIATGKSEE